MLPTENTRKSNTPIISSFIIIISEPDDKESGWKEKQQLINNDPLKDEIINKRFIETPFTTGNQQQHQSWFSQLPKFKLSSKKMKKKTSRSSTMDEDLLLICEITATMCDANTYVVDTIRLIICRPDHNQPRGRIPQ